MKAEIIASGSELLLGQITDTHTAFIASQLATLGIDLYYASVVGDNYERYLGVLRQAWQRSDLIITTGGLGPTQGDITRDVIAGLLGEKMTVDGALKQKLTDFFARLGMEMPPSNLKQASLIPSATAIPNPLGTAPGWWVEKEGRVIVTLPGPPGEMQAMWQSEVLPRLERKSGAIILSRTLKTWGLSEAKVDELMSSFLSGNNPTLATYAKPDGIHLRITAKAETKEAAGKLVSERENAIRQVLDEYIWGTDNDTLEGVLGRLLSTRNLTLAAAESFTGGFLSYSLASIPGAHRYFKGGIVVSDDTRQLLDSASAPATTETAASMAASVRSRFASDIGIAIDGYSEPEGSTGIGKAFIAIDSSGDRGSVVQSYSGRPQQLIRRAVTQALLSLRKFLLTR